MMPSSSWIMISAVILLTADLISFSLSSTHTRDLDYESDSVCNIQDLYNSPYVQAHQIKSTSSVACNNDGKILPSKSSSRKEVHVLYIHFPSNSSQSDEKASQAPQVVLNIITDGKVRDIDVVLILASNHSVTWRIMSESISEIRHLTIWVSRNSRLIPVSGPNVKVRSFETTSNVLLLRRWVTEKFSRLAEMKELNFQRKITVSVGFGSKKGKACREQSMEESVEVTKGCIMPKNHGLNNKDVHIIELEADGVEPSTVVLNIQAHFNAPLRRHLLLVLKSRRPTKWAVFTSKLRGTLDIITDQTVDTNGIDMQSVRVVNERLANLSEMKLVHWTVANYGAPVSYTSAVLANRIELVVDGGIVLSENFGNETQKKLKGVGNKLDAIVQRLLENLRLLVDRHRSVSCHPGSLEVAVLKNPLMTEFSLSNDQLSLVDHNCLAQQNETHFFWKTSSESCGSVLRPHGNKMAIENAILVQPVKQSVGVSVDGFSGSGMESDDGNDDIYNDDTFSDDEDITRGSLTVVRVNFDCSYALEADLPIEGAEFYLKIYKNSLFQHETVSFPVFVGENQQLFVSTGFINDDDSLQPVIQKCSIVPANSSSEPPLEYSLIGNGCTVDKTTSWKETDVVSERRFAFEIRDEWKSHATVFLICYLTVCSRFNHHVAGVEQCKSGAEHCSSSLESNIHARSLQSMKLGPLVLHSAADGAFAGQAPFIESSSSPSYEIRQTMLHEDDTICNQVIRVEGLDSPTVVAIAFAAFLIGALLSGTLWYIHSRTGPAKKRALRRRSAETSGESTPCSTAPITVCQTIDQV